MLFRATNAAPKPNTRFLKSIIRETDSHNAALKKKEELEARIRLRQVDKDQWNGSDYDTSGRHKRRRIADDQKDSRRFEARRQDTGRLDRYSSDRSRSPEPRERRSRHEQRPRRDRSTSRRRNTSSVEAFEEQRRSSHRRTRNRRTDEAAENRGDRESRKTQRRRSRSKDSELSTDHDYEPRRRGHKDQDGTRRERRQRSRSPRHPTTRSPKSTAFPASLSHGHNMHTNATNSDSDPLESIVGPLPAADPPPLRSRGRGAYKPSVSAMDEHFSSTYNPSTDLRPDSEAEDEKEDWDMALEALRDREVWKQKGAERLREAGFAEEEVRKWEDSGREKGVEEVEYIRAGQEREWDVGKVVEQEGEPEKGKKKGEGGLEAAWKRKGGFANSFKKALS